MYTFVRVYPSLLVSSQNGGSGSAPLLPGERLKQKVRDGEEKMLGSLYQSLNALSNFSCPRQ